MQQVKPRQRPFHHTVINFQSLLCHFFVIRNQQTEAAEAAPPPAPTTKECPFCLSHPHQGFLVAHCTSELKAAMMKEKTILQFVIPVKDQDSCENRIQIHIF
jgi:hypothetical protein